MGIWDMEVIRVDGHLFAYIRVDGHLFAYIRVQNDHSGNISGSFRRIYQDKDGHYYAKADGRNQNMDNQVKILLANEEQTKRIRDFYKKYYLQIGGH